MSRRAFLTKSAALVGATALPVEALAIPTGINVIRVFQWRGDCLVETDWAVWRMWRLHDASRWLIHVRYKELAHRAGFVNNVVEFVQEDCLRRWGFEPIGLLYWMATGKR